MLKSLRRKKPNVLWKNRVVIQHRIKFKCFVNLKLEKNSSFWPNSFFFTKNDFFYYWLSRPDFVLYSHHFAKICLLFCVFCLCNKAFNADLKMRNNSKNPKVEWQNKDGTIHSKSTAENSHKQLRMKSR